MLPDPYGSDIDTAVHVDRDGHTHPRPARRRFVFCPECRQDDEDVNQRRCRFCDNQKIARLP